MMPSSTLLLPIFSLITLTAAQSSSSCPSVWTDIATDLKSSFVGTDGLCNDAARQAIRLSFHDCWPESCDGSIVLSDDECSRGENTQMVDICATFKDKTSQYNVSAADLVQFGAAMGIASCPGGPLITTLVGRPSTSVANPSGQMPSAATNATTLISIFAAKGFSTTELVALVGAHTAATNLSDVAMDSTVGDWDNDFYGETQAGTAPSSLDSDLSLAQSEESSADWSTFAGSAEAWLAAFVPAMEKMSVLGNDVDSLVDCSSVVADAFSSSTTSNTDTSKSTSSNSTSDSTSSGTSSASSLGPWSLASEVGVFVMTVFFVYM